jgi:hypothetical protein
MATQTYRELAWSRLLEVVDHAVSTASAATTLPVSVVELRARFDAAIDAIPGIAALLDQSEGSEPARADSDEVVDPINRADDLAARIAGKLHDQ